jgi:hypothetical protein
MSDPELWINLLKNCNQDGSLHMSKLMADFCKGHENLDANFFHHITDKQILPDIYFTAATIFTSLENSILIDDCAKNIDKLSNLQERCLDSLAKFWTDFKADQEDFLSLLKEQIPLLLSGLLAKVLTIAQLENASMKNDVSNLQLSKSRLWQLQ